MKTFVIAAVVRSVHGHGALTFPRPRNALDGNVAPWSNWSFPCDASHHGAECAIYFCYDGKHCAGSCPISAHNGVPGALNASNGQSCYWFSNGCTVGCEECDGTSNHVGHGMQKFLYRGLNASELRRQNITIPNPWAPASGEMLLDKRTTGHLQIKPNCANPTVKPNVCDPKLRTANTLAECGSEEDVYYWSPWRRPGSAPIIDACGTAGGRFPGQGAGGAGAIFQNSTVAYQGMLGSRLPPLGASAGAGAVPKWPAGSRVEVGWTVMANHGGGYAYRLAPATQPLTEDAFRRQPLDFVGASALRWDGDASREVRFDSAARGWQVADGTTPSGSMWRKNPIPTAYWEREGPSFSPVCAESDECKRATTVGDPFTQGVCQCSGHANGGPLMPNLEVVDEVLIPAGLRPGAYVLQWRWDCEESDQVWASCADVEVVAA